MKIIELLRRFSPQMMKHLTIMVFFSGIINGVMLAIIYAVVVSPEKNGVRFFIMYLVALAAFLFSKRYDLLKSALLAESAVSSIR